MPCTNPAHSHEWTTTGTLSIAKCESRCGFCTSIKEYKPASALRKHVATHIRNDGMSLTLAHSKGGRPKLQAVTSPHDVPEEPPRNPELSREHSRSPRPVTSDSPACWRCTILGLECDRVLPCIACIGLDPQRTCGYKNLVEYAALVFWDDSRFPQTLRWRGPNNRLVDISFTGIDTPINLSSHRRHYQTIIPRLMNNLERFITQLIDSQPNLATFSPSVAAEAAITFGGIPILYGGFNGAKTTQQGLSLLRGCCETLDATDRMFTVALSDDPQTKNLDVFRGLVYDSHGEYTDIKCMVIMFLSNLHRAMVKVRTAPKPEDILEAFHGILLLFIVRDTLRSILRYSKSGYASSGHQANQDHSFERGVTCTLYQPMLAVLESSRTTFDGMLTLSMASGPFSTTAALRDAARVIRIPNPISKTPLEHILFFFEQTFPARVANTSQRLGSTATEPSEQLTAVDPSTYLDLPG